MAKSVRRRLHEILDRTEPDDRAARAVGITLILLITANVAAIVLQSEPALDAVYRPWFRAFEVFSVLVFTAEYAVRVWSAVEDEQGRYRRPLIGRLRYMITPLALIDLAAILPFYLSFLFPLDLRFLRVFRLFLIFKLSRYHASMVLLGRVLRNEASSIAAAMFVLTMLLIVASSFAFLAEHRAQPEVFGSMLDAMYWTIVTMTTVGYGDIVPVTPFGKALSAIIGIIGIGMVALPAGFLASGFSEQLHHRRREFEAVVDRILADGTITPEEGDRLKQLRDRLGLTDHQAAEITRLIVRRRTTSRCPHCGELLLPVEHGGHHPP